MVKSEFGRGLVICLVKFAEHFEKSYLIRIQNYYFFLTKLKGNRKKLKSCGRSLQDAVAYFDFFRGKMPEESISKEVELWANGATDHLCEIEVPEGKEWDRIRREVGKLQNKGLEMGHGFTGKTWTLSDVDWLIDQTRRIALMIDRKVGLKPDLGSW